MEFASNAKGNAGLTTGIIGTSLAGALATGLIGNGGLFNQNGNCANTAVSRYELGQSEIIGRLESENALLKSNVYSDQKLVEVYKDLNGRLIGIEAKVNTIDKDVAVNNAKIEGTFAVMGEKLNAQRNEFISALNREADERCCADNAIVNYANATFYVKQVADITTGTTTTAQTTYNPLPNCGKCCRG
jgi:hypothetical protein